jgi:hypothetical protein
VYGFLPSTGLHGASTLHRGLAEAAYKTAGEPVSHHVVCKYRTPPRLDRLT